MFHALLITAALAADPADIADYLAQAEEQRQERMDECAGSIAWHKAAIKAGRGNSYQRNAWANRVKQQTLELRKLRENKGQFIPKLKFEVGSIGHDASTFEILQVLAHDDMIVTLGRKAFWVHGISTAGLTDGEKIKFACLKVTRTRQYGDTGGGTETVFQLEPFDEAAVFADRKQREQEEADAKAAKLAKARDKAKRMKAAKKQGRKS